MKKKIKWLVIDVDGTMTDGGVYYGEEENELKKFNTKDATGIFVAHQAGLKLVVLTGRKCKATERRMRELEIKYLFQGIKDKVQFLRQFVQKNEIAYEEIGYIGDDLNDLAPMHMVGYIGCPADSCKEVKEIADYVSNVKGGEGAVRDIIHHILMEYGEWEENVKKVYSGL